VSFSGGCLCGAVRYDISAHPITTRVCWCLVCQKIAAGNATINVCFQSASVRIEGELRDYVSTADSGNTMHRRFCSACGTHVFSGSEARPQLVFVRSGTLDDRSIVKPASTIWVSRAPPWSWIDRSLPTFDRQPPPLPG
jgi:hypothetical protein